MNKKRKACMDERYLEHHGIKGMKWGIRRYQNEDGTLTDAGKRRYANKYDYRESDSYKNATSRQKTYRTNQYNANSRLYGKKAANRIEYKVDNEGIRRGDATRDEFIKSAVKGLALSVGLSIGSAYVAKAAAKGASWYATKRMNVKLNNIAVDMYTDLAGIEKASGPAGFGIGVNAIKTGKKVYDAVMKMRV